MNDTLMRQWAMLRAIPRHPRRVDAPTIHGQLCDLGMNVTLRTVQRDLNTLAKSFPLDFDESKPQGWCWRQGTGQFEVPSMDAHAALTFNLVEQYMQNLLPRSTLSHMSPWFDAAQGVASSQASSVTKWRDKLRVVPHTFNKVPAPYPSGQPILRTRQDLSKIVCTLLLRGHDAQRHSNTPLRGQPHPQNLLAAIQG